MRSRIFSFWFAASLAALAVCAADAESQLPSRVAATTSSPSAGQFRRLAPGVEITIPPNCEEEDTFAVHDIVEIVEGMPDLEWTPKMSSKTSTLTEMARGTIFRRDAWCLEFTFKPVRMIWVDVPQSSGAMQRKLIWYMVYHVRNIGGHLRPARQDDGRFTFEPIDKDVRFFPTFVLEAPEFGKAYMDRILPTAIEAIRQKEDPNRPLLNSVEVGQQLVQKSSDLVDRSIWGVATWENVDPRVDFFSVHVKGLSNAYQWIDPPGAFTRGAPPGQGRVLLHKTLVLNFWRPGDEYVEDRRTIRFGSPGKVDYEWIYE